MNFKTKKISKHKPKPLKSTEAKSHKILKIKLPIIISILIIFTLLFGIVKAMTNIDFGTFLKVAGDELQQDEYGHTNFLIIGTGNRGHDGEDLTDTIIVASLDDSKKTMTMMSIPRDLKIEDNEVGSSRINEAYYYGKHYYEDETQGFEYLISKVEELTGLSIHYWVKINFDGFTDLVDALGGIDLYVEEAIYDPYYPVEDEENPYNLYEIFEISEGMHHMDGEIALKYVRSRKTTSDFDRAERQQEVIYAIKEKALKKEVILSQQKLKNFLNALKSNIDTNIKVKEILTLGGMAADYSKENIVQRLIHDDPIKCGGLVYPDPNDAEGKFVLIPAGGYEEIEKYADLSFNYPETANENLIIYIFNGTAGYGVAGETKQVLQRYCFEVASFGNAQSQDLLETTYYYEQKYNEQGEPVDSRPKALDFFQKYIPGKENTDIPEDYLQYFENVEDPTQNILIIELGSDYVDSENYMLDYFYYIDSPTHSTNPLVNTNGAPTSDTTEHETE
jgi:LCP family protein required for cell wall assembly